MVRYILNQNQKNIVDNIVENSDDVDNIRSESNKPSPDITKNLWNFLINKNNAKQRRESINIVTDADDLDYLRAKRKKKFAKLKPKRKPVKKCRCKK